MAKQRLYEALGISEERVEHIENLLMLLVALYGTTSRVLEELAYRDDLSEKEKVFAAYTLGYKVAEAKAAEG